MKNSRKMIALVALALVISLMLFSAFAEELSMRYSYIMAITAGLRISGGSASASGKIIPSGSYATRTYVVGHVYDGDGNIIDTGTAYKY